ncbi:hypothetical protein PR202_gb16158 [Eleusine coracana subsp. coracana]|uniref:ABC1 atypical kinase-like domain-containing protein n=1 Tax=Eleusine coracana subsp. coracana TaxID=191504 RepID=A0AAV5EZP3_ELECO|nr:hypothetical protein PR202_gb16158 [Eleusine coracana subsp. coracana]
MEARSHTTAAAPAKEFAGATTKPEVTACGVPPSRMTMNKHSPPRRSYKVEAVSMRAPEDEEDGSAGAVLLLMMRLNEDRARLHYMPYVVLLSCPDISTSGSSMELCTTSIYSSAQRSHVLLPGSCLECQRFARSTSLVPQKRRRSTLYVMNAVTTGRDEEIVPFRARQLRNLLCDLGPSFIKAGQVLANRPDIIREDYMNELCILQDDVPPFPNQVAFEIIEEELGQPMEKLFSRISSETIAAASLGQVYRATLRETGEDVAIKETRNIEDFLENFKNDPTVKIPRVYKQLSGSRVLVMEWIDGIRCTDPQAIKEAGIDLDGFLTVGVSAALRQLLEFGLFHGDPHPGNIFAMRDGRIAYVDFGNVAVLSQQNKQILIDAVVHAVNEDYAEMANDFTRLGFLASGTDVSPIIPALEAIWQNSAGKGLADFNFRSVTGKFNQLVYNYPIRIPERFSLVIRSLLTQEGICFTLKPDFKFLEVAYPYVAKRLLTDPNPALRDRLIQVLFKDGAFQWKRLENLIVLAKENVTKMSSNPALKKNSSQTVGSRQTESKLDLTETIKDGARMFLIDAGIRRQLILAFTEDSKLHVEELLDVYRLVEDQIDMPSIAREVVQDLPSVARDFMLAWSDSVLSDRRY